MTTETETATLRRQLLDHGLLVETPSLGVYGRSGTFEGVLDAFDRLVQRTAAAAGMMPAPEVMRFAPVLHRTAFERTDYLRSFPNLLGSLHCFDGGDAEHAHLLESLEAGEDWGHHLRQSDLVMLPAACYPLYPMVADAGELPPEGRTFDVLGQCFRHEPSEDPARMQCFRMHEYVHVGTPESTLAFRDAWVERCLELLGSLGLPVSNVPANDPFFGRAGRLLAANQRNDELKRELVVPVSSDERPTAIASCNRHLDHLTAAFGIRIAGGGEAHSACVGFGLERCTLALFRWHGLDPREWPVGVRGLLWP